MRAIALILLAAGLAGCGGPSTPEERLLALWAEVHERFDRTNPGRGLTDYPADSPEDIPKSYAMVLLAELDRPSDDTGRPDLAPIAGRWLLANADLDGDGIIGWGVPVAWDAYGDGSVNPANTEYTISTAIAVHALLDWIERSPSAPRQEVLATVRRAFDPYMDPAMASPAGLLPYSLLPQDRPYDTFNPAAYMAGQMQRFSNMVEDPRLRRLLRQRADATMSALLAHRKLSNAGNWYWAYSIQEDHNPNDLPHAAYIIDGILTYAAQGGALAAEFDLPRIVGHVREFVDRENRRIRAWPPFRTDIERSARLYDLGMGLHLVCTRSELADEKPAFLDAAPSYRTPSGAFSRYPVSDQPDIVVNEYEAYLLRGIASCLPGAGDRRIAAGQDASTVSNALAAPVIQEHSRRDGESPDVRAFDQPLTAGAMAVPFVELGQDQDGMLARFDPAEARTILALGDGRQVRFPWSGVPIAALSRDEGGPVVVFRTMPAGTLLLVTLGNDGAVAAMVPIRHADDSEPIFRAAAMVGHDVAVVYYDNVSSRNYLARYRLGGNGIERVAAPLELPLLLDPAGGTYEMIPPVFLLPDGMAGLHILGGTLEARLGPGADRLVSRRIPGCLRIVEATLTPAGPVSLCHERPRGERRAETPAGYRLLGPPGLRLPKLDPAAGIPWNLRIENGDVRIDHAAAPSELARMLAFDLKRGQQSGWLEFGIDNTEGRVPWSQIYYLNGFLDLLWLAAREPALWEPFADILQEMRWRLDLELTLLDRHWREGRYATRAFTVDRSPALFAVQTARLLLVMHRYRAEVPNPLALPGYEHLRRAVHRLDGHIEVMARDGEPARWLLPGRPYLRWPKGSKFSFDGVGVPFNHQNEWAYGVIETALAEPADDSEGHSLGAAIEIVRHFLDRIAFAGHLPEPEAWDYWWGTAFDGWQDGEGVSVNRPTYDGDRIKAWISFRSIDAMAALSAADRLGPRTRRALLDSAQALVERGRLYPFVAYELMRRGRDVDLAPQIAHVYARVSAPWELSNAPWAYRALLRQWADRR